MTRDYTSTTSEGLDGGDGGVWVIGGGECCLPRRAEIATEEILNVFFEAEAERQTELRRGYP
jgi:hypothetical protein